MTVLQPMHKGISQQIFARGAQPRLAPRGRERFPDGKGARGSDGSARRAARTRLREEGSLIFLPEPDGSVRQRGVRARGLCWRKLPARAGTSRPASAPLGSGAREGTRWDGRERARREPGERAAEAGGLAAPAELSPRPGQRGSGSWRCRWRPRGSRPRVTGLENAAWRHEAAGRDGRGSVLHAARRTVSALGPGTWSSRAWGRAEEVKHRRGAGEADPPRELEAESERDREREAPGPGLASAISAERPKRSPRSTLTKEESFIPLIFLMKEKKTKANHALYAAQRGAAGARRGPVPLSHGSGADSHSLPLRPAGRLREAPGSGRRLPKAGPGFTTSKDDARRDELLMLASTPYRSRFLQMEFYSLSSIASSLAASVLHVLGRQPGHPLS